MIQCIMRWPTNKKIKPLTRMSNLGRRSIWEGGFLFEVNYEKDNS